MYNDFMNKEYPVVFIDLDNTFYDHENHVVPKKHIDAIRQLKQKGFKVCTCTGRPMNLVEELNILDLIEWDGHVTGNGSFVYDKDCHLIHQETISETSAQAIFDFAKEHQLSVMGMGTVFIVTQLDQAQKDIIDFFHFKNIVEREPVQSDTFSNLVLGYSQDTKEKLEKANIDGIEPVYMPHCIDIKRAGISKYQGIKVLMDTFGYGHHDYLAFGDSYIDLEMLENAKMGVVMDNGDPRLKEKMDLIAPACSKAGLYTYLKQHHFID